MTYDKYTATKYASVDRAHRAVLSSLHLEQIIEAGNPADIVCAVMSELKPSKERVHVIDLYGKKDWDEMLEQGHKETKRKMHILKITPNPPRICLGKEIADYLQLDKDATYMGIGRKIVLFKTEDMNRLFAKGRYGRRFNRLVNRAQL